MGQNALMAASLMDCAPWLPPAISTQVPEGSMPSFWRPPSRVASRTARLTGRPVTMYLRPRRPATGNASATRLANGAARRLASPRRESASMSTTRRRVRRPAMAAGPAMYPPPPTTTLALRRRSTPIMRGTASTASTARQRFLIDSRRSNPRSGTWSSG